MGKYKYIEEKVEAMSSAELKVFLQILKNQSLALTSTLEAAGDLNGLEEIRKSVQKLINRVSEFDGGSFLILVVGPVKSGKSTLVNLIAHAHVSPTHFLECTVRPSIISKGSEESITRIFSSTDSDQSDVGKKVEQFDSVIDSLRGLDKLENIPGVNIEKCELNDANLDRYVTLALEESVINCDNTLVTSITTAGGELLKENIFLVDMPGLDGGYANLDNPIYETISQRADFVIFVQSSNSAISKVSNRFLKLLQENNPKVPVCLIHNVFEAAYWHSEEEKQAVIKAQMQFAKEEINRRNFQLNDCIYSLNLGKVADAAKYEGIESIREEAGRFLEFERDLYSKVISNNTDIRLRSVIGRTLNQLEKLDYSVNDMLNTQDVSGDEYLAAVASFDELIHKASELSYDGSEYRKMIEVYIKDDLKEFAEIVKEYHDAGCNSVFAGGARGKDGTRAVVTKFMNDSSEAIKSKFFDSHEHSSLRQYLRKLTNLKDDVLFIEKINSFLKEKGCPTYDPMVIVPDFPAVDFDLQEAYDVKNIHHPVVPHTVLPNPFGTYSTIEVQSFLRKAQECIIGIDNTHTGKTIKGYLQLNIGKSIYKAANELYDLYIPARRQSIIDFLKKQKKAYIGMLIPDKDGFDRKNALLRSINKQIQSFKQSIR